MLKSHTMERTGYSKARWTAWPCASIQAAPRRGCGTARRSRRAHIPTLHVPSNHHTCPTYSTMALSPPGLYCAACPRDWPRTVAFAISKHRLAGLHVHSADLLVLGLLPVDHECELGLPGTVVLPRNLDVLSLTVEVKRNLRVGQYRELKRLVPRTQSSASCRRRH